MRITIEFTFYDFEEHRMTKAELNIYNREMAQALYNAMAGYGLNPTMYVEEKREVEGGDLSS